MTVEYLGSSVASGPLAVLGGVQGTSFDEIVEMTVNGTEKKLGRIVKVYGDKAVIQVFKGTKGMTLHNTHTRLTGHPMELVISEDTLGRTFNGIGVPINGLRDTRSDMKLDVNGEPSNPVTCEYPCNYIRAGVSAINGPTTLIREQKLPILFGSGLSHDDLAAQIVQQASLGEDSGEEFAIVFAAMGVKYSVANFLRKTFEESGVSSYMAVFINLANDPVMKRLITPRIVLTLVGYLAFEKGMHTLAILTDMISSMEAIHEVSPSKGEIPSRRGFPGYLYSELATIHGYVGIVAGKSGSMIQIPILTMPNDDVTHPTPGSIGYITEGQIVLDRNLHRQSIYPPINVLPSLSRPTKDGIGKGSTRADHQDVANQLFSCYAKVGDAQALASVIGENELSPSDKKHLEFGEEFKHHFMDQSPTENRAIIDTLTIGWELFGLLPREELDRIDTKVLGVYYKPTEGIIEDQRIGGIS